MIIIGIDPGLQTVGFGVIETSKNRSDKPIILDFGCIITDKADPAGKRLKEIHNEVVRLIEKHKPDLLSVESLFFFKNAKTIIPVSQAKGVILLAAAKKNIPVVEFTPLQVKMTVVGYGRAEKKQVQEMTGQLLDMSSFNLKEKSRKRDDAADALGIALCGFLSS